MKTTGIYFIKNTRNDKVYIGQSVDVFKRLRRHRNMLSKGVHVNPHLQRAFNLDGKFFEMGVLFECQKERLNILEMWMIWYYRFLGKSYNLKSGGSEEKFSEESRRKMSLAQRGNKNSVGLVRSDEFKAKVSASKRGTKRQPDGTYLRVRA